MVALTEIISMLVPAYLLLWVIQFVQQFLPPPGLNQTEDVLSYLPWLGLPLKLNLRREAHTTGKFLSLNIYLAGFFFSSVQDSCVISFKEKLRHTTHMRTHTTPLTQTHTHSAVKVTNMPQQQTNKQPNQGF
jgi:hypothetical protein